MHKFGKGKGDADLRDRLILLATTPQMVKCAQAIRRLLPTNCLSVFHHFWGLVVKGLNVLDLRNIVFIMY